MAQYSQAFLNRLGAPGLMEKSLMEAAGGLASLPQELQDSRGKDQAQQQLQQFAGDPTKLFALGQQYELQGKADVSKVFYSAAEQAKAQRTAKVSSLETAGQDIQKEAQRKRAVQVARQKGDQDALTALAAGALDPVEYLKGLTVKPENKILPGGSRMIDGEGNVIVDAVYKPEAPKEPKIDIKESEGEFVVFENGVEVRRYDTPEKAGKAAAELKKSSRIVTKARGVQLKIDDALGMIENETYVGGWAGLLKYLPDTEARRFEGLITSVKANVGFDQLLAIKEGGSTLGQVSNIENLLLQSTIDSLDTLTSKEDLTQALNRIDAYYTSLITKTQYGEEAPLKDWAGTVEWTNPEFARMYEQSGGEIVINEQEGTVLVKAPNGEMVKLLVDR